jgi:hypothetical protein
MEENKFNKYDTIGTLLAVVSCILMWILDNDFIIGISCVLPSLFYLISHTKGEVYARPFLGIKTGLPLAFLWLLNAGIWFL